MEETFRELNLLIHDGTKQELPETEREQKRKAATLKARELEKAFTGTILKVQGKKALRTLVLVVEKAIHIWLEKLYQNRPSTHKRNRTNEQLEIWCTDTLSFIRRHFPEHFNLYEPMPVCLWEPHKTQHEHYWTTIETDYPELVASGLLPLLKGIYKNQLYKTGTHNYYQTEYWTDLLACLPTEQPGVYSDALKATLVTLVRRNCNHELFIHYFMERAALHQDESPTAIIHWVKYLQWVDRIPLIDYTGAEPALPPVKKQLKEAIQSELVLYQQEAMSGTANPSLPSTSLFHTSLSVSQLAVMFRLLTEAGILISDNNRELMRIVSKTFLTSRAQNGISEKHLYDKFYNVESSAISIVRTHIMTMLQKIAQL
jgi:hypothetical protein